MIADLDKSAIASSNTLNLVVADNLIYGTTGAISEDPDVVAVQTNTTMADPDFVDAVNFNFSLESTSLAIGLADASESPADDYFQNMRDANPDLGSIEYLPPLPIELLTFNVFVNREDKVSIEWSTLNEVDNDYFIVEKSRDGINWENLNIVEGAGNSTVLLEYSIFDHHPYESVNYYRLKQVNFDRSYTFSDIKSITLNLKEPDLLVYPNPCYNEVFIEGITGMENLKIYDVLGNDWYEFNRDEYKRISTLFC